MLRGLLRPRWVALHVTIACLVVAMINLGAWQLRRLEWRRSLNATIAGRTEVQPVPLLRLDGDSADRPDEAEWRRVIVTGTYDARLVLSLVNRSANGTAGSHQVVPMRTDSGAIVLVNRGFVPLDGAGVAAPVPAGRLSAVGYLRQSQDRGTLGIVDSSDAGTVEFNRLDLPRISSAIGEPLWPMWVQLVKESPSPSTTWPALVPLPEATEGSHLSYAVQWFFFSAVATAGWTVATRRKWRAGQVPGS